MIADEKLKVDNKRVSVLFQDDGEQQKIRQLLTEGMDIIRLRVILQRKCGQSFYPFRRVCRGGNKDHDFILLHRDGELAGMTRREFEVNISLKINGGKMYTFYPENSVNLLALSREGRVRMYQYSIVGRWGDLFLSKQMLFEGEMKNGEIFCPTTPWMSMESWCKIWEEGVIKRRFKEWGWLIPENKESREFSPILVKNKAFVLWFNIAMGYGYARLKDGRVARIHWSNLPKGQICLEAGRFVSYQDVKLHYSSHNNNAVWQLINVAL